MMTFHQRSVDALHLVGISMRTSFDDASEDIPAFWDRVLGQGLLDEIQTSEPGAIYAVYKDMEDAWRGAYTMVLAVAVEPDSATPQGFERVAIDRQRRAVAILPDDTPETLMAAWGYVWREWPQRERRAYGVDLEIHRPRADGGREVSLSLTMID